MPSRLRVFLSICIFAGLVSTQLLAQSQRASIAGHRARASKATAGWSNASPASGLSFAAAVPYFSGGNGANAVAIADVNGDGFPDLVVTNWCSDSTCTGGAVGVLLGKGDGTFQAAVLYPSGGLFANSVAIADVNGDGNLDLVVANCGSNSPNDCVSTSNSGAVAVLLGKGDGTFQTAAPYSLGANGATSVAVADVNGDGKLDVIVATGSNTAGLVGVLLGNGDGTFQAEVTYGSGGISPLALAVADVNGDGHPDVVIANQCVDSTCTSSNVGVLLNSGTGTFETATTYGSGGLFPDWVVITDVNGDSKPDLVVANSSTSTTVDNGNVGVLLGKGDGTFQTAAAYPSGGFGAASVAVADVNGDSNPDLVVVNCSATSSSCVGGGGTVGVLLGNGKGTFQTAVTLGAGGNTPFGVAVADVNGDSKPDIVAANCSSNYCGAANGSAGVLLNTSTAVGQTTTALASLTNPSKLGQSVTFTGTVTSQAFDGRPTGTVSFFDGPTKIGSSNLDSSGVATFATPTLAFGMHSVTATYNNGNPSFAPSTSPAVQQVVQNVSTTSLNVSPGTAAVGTSVTLTATVSSPSGTPPDGETVTFKDATGTLATGKLSKGTATFTSTTIPAGTYSVVASYPGDADFLPSTSIAQTLDVQSFTLTANPTTVTVSAPGQSGSTTITIETSGNLKGTSVTGFACSGLPSGSACTFGAVGSNDTVTLSITTTGPSAGIFRHHQGLFYAMLLPGFLGMLSMAGRKRTLRGVRLLALIVVLGLSVMWVACGGSSSGGTTPPPNTGTPTGTSTVTVSAASGTLQRSTKITLTVQ